MHFITVTYPLFPCIWSLGLWIVGKSSFTYKSSSVGGSVVCTPSHCGKWQHTEIQVVFCFFAVWFTFTQMIIRKLSRKRLLPCILLNSPFTRFRASALSSFLTFMGLSLIFAGQQHNTLAASALLRSVCHMRGVWLVCCHRSAETGS